MPLPTSAGPMRSTVSRRAPAAKAVSSSSFVGSRDVLLATTTNAETPIQVVRHGTIQLVKYFAQI